MTSGIPVLIAAGLLKLGVFCIVTQWLAKRARLRLRWLRMAGLAFALCLLSLPSIAVLLWFSPSNPVLQHCVILAIGFVPLFGAMMVALPAVRAELRTQESLQGERTPAKKPS